MAKEAVYPSSHLSRLKRPRMASTNRPWLFLLSLLVGSFFLVLIVLSTSRPAQASATFLTTPNFSISPNTFVEGQSTAIMISWNIFENDLQIYQANIVIPGFSANDSQCPAGTFSVDPAGVLPERTFNLECNDSSSSTLCVDLNEDGQCNLSTETLVLVSNGSVSIDVTAPFGGDSNPIIKEFLLSGQLRLEIFEGTFTPVDVGSHQVTADFISVDPDSGHADVMNEPPLFLSINSTVQILPDSDGDGVPDGDDQCPGSVLDEINLNPNRYAQNSSFGPFEVGPNEDQSVVYDMTTTSGCTCAQIVGVLGVGRGHLKRGCSPSVMEAFTATSANPDR